MHRPTCEAIQSLSDTELVEIIRREDTLLVDMAMQTLMKRYRGMLERVISKYFTPFGDRSDLMQEGYISLYRAALSYDGSKGASFYTYVEMVIRNNVVNYVKAMTRHKHQFLTNSKSLESVISSSSLDGSTTILQDTIADKTPTAEERTVQREELTSFLGFMKEKLSRLEFQVALMHAHSFSVSDIMEATGVTSKSIDNSLQRVRKKLNLYIELKTKPKKQNKLSQHSVIMPHTQEKPKHKVGKRTTTKVKYKASRLGSNLTPKEFLAVIDHQGVLTLSELLYSGVLESDSRSLRRKLLEQELKVTLVN